jgi:Polysaccharide lyase
MVWLQNDKLYVRLRSGVVCTEDKGDVQEFKIGDVVPGQWHTLMFGVLWHKDKRGWFKVWYDQKLRIDKEDVKTFLDTDDRLFQFRVGMYPNWWTWNGAGHPFILANKQHKKELYIDHVGFGPDPADADPWASVVTKLSLETRIKHYQTFIARMKKDSPTYVVDLEKDLIYDLKEALVNVTASENPDESQELRIQLAQQDAKKKMRQHASEPKLKYTPPKADVVTPDSSR